MKSFLALLVLAAVVSADDKSNEWWDPLDLVKGNQDKPILARLTPAVQSKLFH